MEKYGEDQKISERVERLTTTCRNEPFGTCSTLTDESASRMPGMRLLWELESVCAQRSGKRPLNPNSLNSS